MISIYSSLLALAVILFIECGNPQNERSASNDIDPAMLKGAWYLNKWTMYHTLDFSDSTVFCDNHVDTIFTLSYSIHGDSIETGHPHSPGKFKRKIKKLNENELILEGFHDKDGELVYSRIQKK